jgi:hypothetical protein
VEIEIHDVSRPFAALRPKPFALSLSKGFDKLSPNGDLVSLKGGLVSLNGGLVNLNGG